MNADDAKVTLADSEFVAESTVPSNATTSTGTASPKLDSDPLGSPFSE
jgi:hypothetical protein